MFVTIEAATDKEKEAAKRVLSDIEAIHKKEIEKYAAALSALSKCEPCEEVKQAEELIKSARSPHIGVITALRRITLVTK